jgi:hypothetical protein
MTGWAAIAIAWAVASHGVADSQRNEHGQEQTSQPPGQRTWTGRLNLGIPGAASAVLIRDFASWRITAPEARAAAERAIQTWEAQELAYEAREWASLREQIAAVTSGIHGRWIEEESRRVAFIAASKERARLVARLHSREAALLAALARLANEDPSSEPWMTLAGDCEATRACAISTAMPGAQTNLSRVVALARSRCEILRDLAWRTDRTRFARMLAGRGVVKVDHEQGRKRLMSALQDDVSIHRCILEDGLGVTLADDPCLAAWSESPNRFRTAFPPGSCLPRVKCKA